MYDKKLTKQEIEKTEKEISLLETFQDKDKFIFSIYSNACISSMAVFLAVLLVTKNLKISYFMISILIMIFIFFIYQVKTFKELYCGKIDLIIKKYKKIGCRLE